MIQSLADVMEILVVSLLIIIVSSLSFRKKRSVSKKSRYERFAPFDRRSARTAPQRSFIRGTAYVVDGDTLIIQRTQIRLFGIDAPEMDHPFGNSAKWALISL